MYDFCLTLPYAALLAIGGLMGYLTKGSMLSLGSGLGAGAALAVLGYISLSLYHKQQSSKTVTFLSLVISVALTYVMYERFRKTGAIFPAAVIGVVSALMALFYVWSIALGPVPGKPKLKK